MKVIDTATIFKNDLGFSTSISNKRQDGTYENMYISVQFRKDDIEAQRMSNMTKINIKNGFLSFYKTTSGQPKIKLIITDYEIIDENRPAQETNDDPFVNEIPENFEINDDDLPF